MVINNHKLYTKRMGSGIKFIEKKNQFYSRPYTFKTISKTISYQFELATNKIGTHRFASIIFIGAL